MSRSHHRTIALAGTVLAGCLLSPMSGLSAQSDNGGIFGKVSDPSGAALPGALVTATATERQRQTNADDVGHFQFTNLPPGIYVVTAELPGFKSARREVTVTASGSVPADLGLRVGCTSEVLYVVWDAAELWKQATLIAQVRIDHRSVPIHFEDDCGVPRYRYTATVKRELKQPSFHVATGRSMALFTTVALLPQHEYVVWLQWQPDTKTFGIMFNADTALAPEVISGRLEWMGHYIPVGVAPRTTVDEFFAMIAALRRNPLRNDPKPLR